MTKTRSSPVWDGSGEQLVKAIRGDFRDPLKHTGAELCQRPVHTAGISVGGYFQASDDANRFSRAGHFAGGRVPVTVRFSNGAGTRVEHDRAQDVRGMATRFHLGDDHHDLVAMTLPIFFVRTVDDFLAFCRAGDPEPVPHVSIWQQIRRMLSLEKPPPAPPKGATTSGTPGLFAFAAEHSEARGAIAAVGSIVTPRSYVRASYHAVHAFEIRNDADDVRYARFTWEPVAGVQPRKPKPEQEVSTPDEVMHRELHDLLAEFPQQMTLRMQIADAGDDTADATKSWPDSRIRVNMGILTITHVLSDQELDCEQIGFNPTKMVDGIACSDDPLLAARGKAYPTSQEMRRSAPTPPEAS